MVKDAYAPPLARKGFALARGVVSPDTSERYVARLFHRAGITQFPSAGLGTLKDVLVACLPNGCPRRHPVRLANVGWPSGSRGAFVCGAMVIAAIPRRRQKSSMGSFRG